MTWKIEVHADQCPACDRVTIYEIVGNYVEKSLNQQAYYCMFCGLNIRNKEHELEENF